LESCIKKVAKGYIVYDFKSQQHILPNIVTMAGLIDAIPIDLSVQDAPAELINLYDHTVQWNNYTDLMATEYMFDYHINQTRHMAKINPGYDVHSKEGNVHKNLTGMIDFKFMDYSVKERMFSFFMVDGCIPGAKEHALTEKIATNNPWPRPITVYGYDDTWGIKGDLFEAETTCVPSHNMG
jgi:hypothetical protein